MGYDQRSDLLRVLSPNSARMVRAYVRTYTQSPILSYPTLQALFSNSFISKTLGVLQPGDPYVMLCFRYIHGCIGSHAGLLFDLFGSLIS